MGTGMLGFAWGRWKTGLCGREGMGKRGRAWLLGMPQLTQLFHNMLEPRFLRLEDFWAGQAADASISE